MVLGTYIHGLFYNDGIRASVLRALACKKGVSLPSPEEGRLSPRDGEYDKLADLVRDSLRMDLVYDMAGLDGPRS